jgi:histidinol-phosphate aminotransferase
MVYKVNNKLLSLKTYDYTEINDNNKIYLDLNENIFIEQHEDVLSFITNKLKYLYLYPRSADITNTLLYLLSEYCDICNNNIYVTSGSDNALKYVFNTFCVSDTKTLILVPTYDMIYNFIGLTDTEIINLDICSEQTVLPNIDEIFYKIKDSLIKYKPNLFYFCNPNNPLSYFLPKDKIKILLEEFKETVFLIDEAYIEFLKDHKKKSIITLINNYNNLIITRTFSKAFGMASLRIGYMVSNYKNIEIIKRQGNNKDVLEISKLAAITALNNISFYNYQFESLLKLNINITNNINNIINKYPNGDIYNCIGKTNGGWISLLCNNPNKLIQYLDDEYNIIVRNKSHNNIGIVRISLGKEDIMDIVVNACKEYQRLTSKISNS